MKNLFGIALLWCFALAVQADTSSFTYYVNDALGSPVVAMNQAGDVVWRKAYQPYGKASGKDGGKDGDNRVGYTGHVEDKSDLVYAGARYYDPTLGRFLSDDPVRFSEKNPMSFNRYAYANNNPYRYVDPDGRDVIVLNDSGAFYDEGHNAALIGSVAKGWDFYSKNGGSDNVHIHYEKREDFTKDADVSSRFDRAVSIKTDESQDTAMVNYAESNYKSEYYGLTNNCGDLVDGILTAAVRSKDDSTLRSYEPSKSTTFGVTRPNKQFNDLKTSQLTPTEMGLSTYSSNSNNGGQHKN